MDAEDYAEEATISKLTTKQVLEEKMLNHKC